MDLSKEVNGSYDKLLQGRSVFVSHKIARVRMRKKRKEIALKADLAKR